MKTLVLAGSSRTDGDTLGMVRNLTRISGWDLVDLNDYSIRYYDYEHANRGDDYLGLMEHVIENYDTLVFATPVYWYAMSGVMKVFFDRLSDLLTIEKDLGKRLRGKSMAVITCSIGNHLGDDFWLPFSHTADYLGMNFLGGRHTLRGKPDTEFLADFIRVVERKA